MEHIIFECGRFTVNRTKVVRDLGRGPVPEDVAEAPYGPIYLVAVEDGVVEVSPVVKAITVRRLWVTMVEAIMPGKDERQRQVEGRRTTATTRRDRIRKVGSLQ